MSQQDSTFEELHQAARNIILRQLSAAPKSRYQLAQKLADRDIPEDVSQAVLDRFEEVELIDDASYAQMWVQSRHRSKGLARRALNMELKQRGIDEHLAAAALDQVTDDAEWSTAYALVEKRISRSTKLPSTDPSERKERDRLVRRLVGMLSRKGYPPGLAFSVVTDVLKANDIDYLDE